MTAPLGEFRNGEHGRWPAAGRHHAPHQATHGTMGDVPAGMRSREAHSGRGRPDAPRVRSLQVRADPDRSLSTGAPLSRAARTAGLSLAALGALAGAGGVATGELVGATDDPTATGEFALPTHLVSADTSLATSAVRAVEATAPSAPSVMPAVSSPSSSPVSSSAASAAPAIKTTSPVQRAERAATEAREARAAEEKSEREARSQASSGVVELAKGQVGTPYVWGGTSTSGFDCSGLVQWAYEKMGKDLPRTSAAQSQTGEKVSLDELQPGDLVFMYSPVTHVAMYAGDGKIVEAPQSGENVRVTSLDRYDGKITGARRV